MAYVKIMVIEFICRGKMKYISYVYFNRPFSINYKKFISFATFRSKKKYYIRLHTHIHEHTIKIKPTLIYI